MAETRRNRNYAVPMIPEEENGFVDESVGEAAPVFSVSSPSETEISRSRLRERWELASVLNFLHVFKAVIRTNLEISGEEIETALITPNNELAQLHISILKGIPPISKNLTSSDAWVAILRKKLAPWWQWVAEGEIPLVAVQGEEISRYKDLDPTTRLLILKALCEIRAYQDDILSYMNEAIKKGSELSSFRKDKIAEDGKGTAYWYDGDSVIGHRLYREVIKVELMQRLKGKGRSTQPINRFEWETLATNLEEFQQISDKLSSSKIMVEVDVAKFVENKIIPVLERIQKRKERALKQQQRKAMLVNGFLDSYQTGYTRNCRTRKPVNYTFDEYDKSIDEAIQLIKKKKTTEEEKHEENDDGQQDGKNDASDDSSALNDDTIKNDADDIELRRFGSAENESEDDDYDGKNEEDDDSDRNLVHSSSSEKEDSIGVETKLNSRKQKGPLAKDIFGLRRSKRLNTTSLSDMDPRSHADTKKMMRQRPVPNTIYDIVISDTEDDNYSENITNNELGAQNQSPLDVLKGLLEESEENNDA